jgi:multidrug resistance protein, MATE family
MQANLAQKDYRIGTSNKAILALTLPIALSILVPQLNFITNNIFLGQLNQQALAVAGFTGVYYLIFAVLGHGLNNTMQMFIARKAGENKINEVGTIFYQGVCIAVAFAAIGIGFTYFIAPTIIKLVLKNNEDITMSIRFLQVRIWGLFFLYLYQMRNALLVGTNQTKLLIIGTAAEAISNVVFDYGLIFGNLGLPNLGFMGAAYASIISECIGFVAIFLVLHFKGISKDLQLYKNTKFNKTISIKILKKSAPTILQYLISIISWEFFYILIEHKGTQASAISNVMRNVFGFFGCITWAFASTSNTMVSNIIGQGLEHKVENLVIKIMKLSILFSVIVCIIINITPTLFLSVYGQGNNFIAAAIPVLRVVSVALVLMSIGVVWLNAVIGTGQTKINLYIEIVAIVLYCSYVYTVMHVLDLNIAYGWASEWLYWISLFIPSFVYIKSGKWKHKKL